MLDTLNTLEQEALQELTQATTSETLLAWQGKYFGTKRSKGKLDEVMSGLGNAADATTYIGYDTEVMTAYAANPNGRGAFHGDGASGRARRCDVLRLRATPGFGVRSRPPVRHSDQGCG